MVVLSQGCMFLVQVSGSAALIHRQELTNNRCPDCGYGTVQNFS